jgi:hypothetical protein
MHFVCYENHRKNHDMLYFEPNEACSGSFHGLPGEKNARASLLILGGNIDCCTFAAMPLFAPDFCFLAVLVLVFLQFKAEIVQKYLKTQWKSSATPGKAFPSLAAKPCTRLGFNKSLSR